jgi:hypothetical protein
MSSDGVFHLRGEKLNVLRPRRYESEDLLQGLLADYPEVLAGPTTLTDEHGALVLVRREMPVPSRDGAIGGFSLDHLFVDRDGVLVLVEVKRSSDTRIRREVVGQMLDYAANAVRYWPVEDLRGAHTETHAVLGRSLEDVWPGLDVEEFWSQVGANLAVGRVRLVFLADELPVELVRVIEFLNAQMSPAEVLGVELRRYVTDDEQETVLVPRVIGRTLTAIAAKERSSGGQLSTRQSLLADAQQRCGPDITRLIEFVLDDAEESNLRLVWGRGVSESVGVWGPVTGADTRLWMIQMGTPSAGDPARLEVHFARALAALDGSDDGRLEQAAQALAGLPPFTAKVRETRERGWAGRPQFPLETLPTDDESVRGILAGLHLLVDRPTE